MSLTFPVLGYGTLKVSDDLYVWLIAQEPPSEEAAARAVASLPPDLATWIRPTADNDGGAIGWTGPTLCLYTGYGVRYYVQTLEPEHLSWLPDSPDLSEGDIERILVEVMDSPRKGPRAPKDEAWRLFGAQLATWLQAVHEATPLWLAVIGRKVKPPGSEPHRQAVDWIQDHLRSVVSRVAALREAHGTSYDALGWTVPLTAAVLDRSRAKSLSEETRWDLLHIIDGAGLAGDAHGTALLNAWPRKARAATLAQLLREGHDLGLYWLTGKSTCALLLDDRVAEAAAKAPRGLLSPYVVTQALARTYQPPKGLDMEPWLRRFVDAASPFADEHVEGPAEARPDDRQAQADLADWKTLRGLIS